MGSLTQLTAAAKFFGLVPPDAPSGQASHMRIQYIQPQFECGAVVVWVDLPQSCAGLLARASHLCMTWLLVQYVVFTCADNEAHHGRMLVQRCALLLPSVTEACLVCASGLWQSHRQSDMVLVSVGECVCC